MEDISHKEKHVTQGNICHIWEDISHKVRYVT